MSGRPVPEPSALSEPFWAAAAEGRLVVQRCETCGGYEWTPQVACSVCWTETLAWTQVSGLGVVYSFSVVHRAQGPGFETPYVVAIVELDEGPRLLTDLVDVEPDRVRVGMEVAVALGVAPHPALYHFRPRSEAS